ncbi:MAG: hypothetical protein Q9224_007448, partial [Gallowayella concinna]
HLINQPVEDLEEIHNFNPKEENLMAPVTCVEALPPMAQFYHRNERRSPHQLLAVTSYNGNRKPSLGLGQGDNTDPRKPGR